MINILKKRKEKKGLLYLIVIVTIISVMAIACKKRTTQPLEASVTGDVTETEYQNPEDAELRQYAGEYRSVYDYSEGYGNGKRTFYYKVELKEVNGKFVLLWKKGDYRNAQGQSYGTGNYDVIRTLNRDKAKDADGKMAFSDYRNYNVAFNDNGNSLTLMGEEIAARFEKIK